MPKRGLLLFVILCSFIISTGCTRKSEEFEIPEAEDEIQLKKPAGGLVSPKLNMPDVKIDPGAEIPSYEGATDVKVPDVQINATEGIGDIDETRVDGMDNTIDEP